MTAIVRYSTVSVSCTPRMSNGSLPLRRTVCASSPGWQPTERRRGSGVIIRGWYQLARGTTTCLRRQGRGSSQQQDPRGSGQVHGLTSSLVSPSSKARVESTIQESPRRLSTENRRSCASTQAEVCSTFPEVRAGSDALTQDYAAIRAKFRTAGLAVNGPPMRTAWHEARTLRSYCRRFHPRGRCHFCSALEASPRSDRQSLHRWRSTPPTSRHSKT